MSFYTYIFAGDRDGALRIGSTGDLARHVQEHRGEATDGLTSDEGADRLVWFEAHASCAAAVEQARRMKDWKRAWTLRAIEAANPGWEDLTARLEHLPPSDPFRT